MVRPPCYDNLNVKKGLWTKEENAKILAYVSKHGTGNWTAVPKKADKNVRPCCDNLNFKKSLWTEEEDAKILAYVSKQGTGTGLPFQKKQVLPPLLLLR
ncbi:hypothetical protein CRYUN_Cryun19dG0041300 [Craigia yunnanensis]